jgi:type III restriction enzyme
VKKIDPSIKKTGEDKGLSDDVSAYDLILKNKERLLSFVEPVRFIFSHSALREGWDNPNVFQICTLREMTSEHQRRQTIGRGLRLCVNQDGERPPGFEINTLTVIATESYEQFADKRIDYGKLRLSSLSSMKGGSLYQLGLHVENSSAGD